MYSEHFGFSEQPFGLTPNTTFFLNTAGHQQAFNLLQVALANGEGFIKIVGEVGTGKTMLCRQLLKHLENDYVTAYIPNPYLKPQALYRAVLTELQVATKKQQPEAVDTVSDADKEAARYQQESFMQNYLTELVSDESCDERITDEDDVHEYQKLINHKLIELAAHGKRVVLVIDEAQAMPRETLEALRLISNLETETSKLIHIVLFGQPELDTLLDTEGLRQLRQRIVFSANLSPLDLEATKSYINHRVTLAGHNAGPLFTDSAIQLIYKVSQGVPRLINILSHKSLMSAFGKGQHNVDYAHVVAAVEDSDNVSLPRRWPSIEYLMAATAVMLACALALLWSGKL